MLNIMVVGTGGVGTMACVALEKSGRASVTAVLRTNYDKVMRDGFEIKSIDHGDLTGWKPSKIVSSVTAGVTSQPFDYVVVTMKNLPDVTSIPDVIRPAITPNLTTIVLIQNGIGIEQPLIEAFPACAVLSGVSMIGAHQHNGHIIHDDHDHLDLGAFHNSALSPSYEASRAQQFSEVYSTAPGPTCTVHADITYMRWRKLIWNGTFNTICALTQLDSTKVRLYGGEHSLIRPAMVEMRNIALAAGYNLPAEVADTMIATTPLELEFRPSMLVDVDKGNPIEVEVILGNPLRRARELGVQTPMLDMVYRLLRLVQARLLDAKGLVRPPGEVPGGDVFDVPVWEAAGK